MKTDILTLKDLFKIGYDAYEDSRVEAAEVLDLFHNRQYTAEQLATLADRGQPAETFNVIKLFGRLILGYYSTIVNTVKVSPEQMNDVLTASLLNDVVDYTMRNNQFETEGDKVKLDGLLQGLMCVFVDIKDTGKKDQFGRKLRKVELSHVPAEEIVLDPLSQLEDYSDARFLHRFKWMSEEQVIKTFKDTSKIKEKVEELQEYYNHLNIEEGEFEYKYGNQFDGYYKRYNNYLVVNTIITDDDDKTWSIYWCNETELERKEITFKEVKFNYRIHKIHTSNKTEYYGLFREVIESQKAINQAILKIQLMVNTQKAFLEKGAVDNIAEFTNQFNRVNAIIQVKSLKKILIENLSREALEQYTIVDKALDRIQRVLGVNDSFLGLAFASDSGRKVKLQQNATSLALRYVSSRIEQFYRLLGWDIVNLIKQYYTATQALNIADESVGTRWVEINKPMVMWTGEYDEQGQPIMDYVWEEVIDPATGKPEIDDEGNYIIAPVPEADTEIAFTDVDINIDSVIFNDEDEKNQLMMETILQGTIGQNLIAINPAGYFKATALTVKSMKTKHSIDIGQILEQTSEMIAQQGNQLPQEGEEQQQPGSTDLKLPQNTNEGL